MAKLVRPFLPITRCFFPVGVWFSILWGKKQLIKLTFSPFGGGVVLGAALRCFRLLLSRGAVCGSPFPLRRVCCLVPSNARPPAPKLTRFFSPQRVGRKIENAPVCLPIIQPTTEPVKAEMNDPQGVSLDRTRARLFLYVADKGSNALVDQPERRSDNESTQKRPAPARCSPRHQQIPIREGRLRSNPLGGHPRSETPLIGRARGIHPAHQRRKGKPIKLPFSTSMKTQVLPNMPGVSRHGHHWLMTGRLGIASQRRQFML